MTHIWLQSLRLENETTLIPGPLGWNCLLTNQIWPSMQRCLQFRFKPNSMEWIELNRTAFNVSIRFNLINFIRLRVNSNQYEWLHSIRFISIRFMPFNSIHLISNRFSSIVAFNSTQFDSTQLSYFQVNLVDRIQLDSVWFISFKWIRLISFAIDSIGCITLRSA